MGKPDEVTSYYVSMSDIDAQNARNLEQRRAAYDICRERGHSSDWSITQGYGPTKNRCKYCGTLYWTTHENHEEGSPYDEEPAAGTHREPPP